MDSPKQKTIGEQWAELANLRIHVIRQLTLLKNGLNKLERQYSSAHVADASKNPEQDARNPGL